MVEPRFVELLTKDLIKGLTSAEKQELDLLLNENPSYKKQSAIIKEYWKNDTTEYTKSAANFSKLMEVIRVAEQSVSIDNQPEPEPEPKRFTLWPLLKYAAAVLVLCATITWYIIERQHHNTSIASNWQHTTTAPKQKERLVLSDGTIVRLNSGTTLSYPLSFSNNEREVYLNGEAYFEVHKDPKRPFIIHTKKMNVRVLGTVFNVKSFDDAPHSETSLIEGSVEVTLNDRKADRIILKPKEKLIIENNPSTATINNKPAGLDMKAAVEGPQYALTNLTYLPSIDSAAVETLWLKNKLVFRNEEFGSIAAEMERWYGIQILFQDQELTKLRFTAKFEKETAIQVLESLRLTADFRLKKDGSTFYILK